MKQDANDKKNISGGVFAPSTDRFHVRSATASVSFDMEDIIPPSAEYVGVDDQLLIQTNALFSANTLLVQVRILRPDGIIVPLHYEVFTGATFNAFVTQLQPLMEGFLLSVVCTATSPTVGQNTMFASVSLVRQANTFRQQYRLLCAGYVQQLIPIGWPESSPQRETDGPGYPMSNGNLNVPAAGAGADFVYTVPAGCRVRVTSISGLLTTAAAVFNRLPSLIIDDGATPYAIIPSNNTQAASLAEQYTWADSTPFAALFDNKVLGPLPSQLILQQGHRVRSNTTGIQAADQWSNLRMLGHVWSEHN